MLCESWSNALSDVNVDGYVRVGKHRKQKNKARRHSGGLEIYIKENISHGVTNENWDFEDGLNLKFDADMFGWQKDMHLLFTYFKPINSSRHDILADNDCFEKLINQIAKINANNGDILVCGDLNSRVAELNDCLIDFDVDICNLPGVLPPDFYNNSFVPNDFIKNNMSVMRSNRDKKTNDYGIKLIQLCKSCDLAILNGRAGSDKNEGKTTFSGPRGESTVDYVLCNKYVLNNVTDFCISDPLCFSDHKKVCFKLKSFVKVNTNSAIPTLFNDKPKRPKWKEEKKESYLKNINDCNLHLKFDELIKSMNDNPCIATINDAVKELSLLITNAGDDHKVNQHSNFVFDKGHIWYDNECKIERNKFLELKFVFLNDKSDFNREEMCKQRSIYRQICRKKRRLFKREEATDLVKLSKENSKMFWKKLKGNSKKQQIPDLNFKEYFENLANKESNISDVGKDEISYFFKSKGFSC